MTAGSWAAGRVSTSAVKRWSSCSLLLCSYNTSSVSSDAFILLSTAANAEQSVLPVSLWISCLTLTHLVRTLTRWMSCADAVRLHAPCLFSDICWTERSNLNSSRRPNEKNMHVISLISSSFVHVISSLNGSFLFLLELVLGKQVLSIAVIKILINCWEQKRNSAL